MVLFHQDPAGKGSADWKPLLEVVVNSIKPKGSIAD